MRRSTISLWLGIALSTVSALTATADTLPIRKAGLWESKSTAADGNHTVRQCIDAATDQQMQGLTDKMGVDCSKKQLTKTATGYVSETICKMGTISMEGKAVMTGDFNASVRIETDSKITGIPGVTGAQTSRTVIESRWIGPCEAGQKPGDIVLDSGKTVKMPAMPR